jgi:hypothetical protein
VADGIVVAGIAGPGGTPPAYAVEGEPDGTVTVSVGQLFDLRGLQRALDRAGVPGKIVLVEPGCHDGPARCDGRPDRRATRRVACPARRRRGGTMRRWTSPRCCSPC